MTAGDKVDNRRQSRQQAIKSTTSWVNILNPQSQGHVQNRLAYLKFKKRLRTGVEPRTGEHDYKIEKVEDRRRAEDRWEPPAGAQYT